jgi:hypothetical protein
MLASKDDLRKSMTFLIPGVKLVMKTFPSESFSRIVQLKSFEEGWKTLRVTRRVFFQFIVMSFSGIIKMKPKPLR